MATARPSPSLTHPRLWLRSSDDAPSTDRPASNGGPYRVPCPANVARRLSPSSQASRTSSANVSSNDSHGSSVTSAATDRPAWLDPPLVRSAAANPAAQSRSATRSHGGSNGRWHVDRRRCDIERRHQRRAAGSRSSWLAASLPDAEQQVLRLTLALAFPCSSALRLR